MRDSVFSVLGLKPHYLLFVSLSKISNVLSPSFSHDKTDIWDTLIFSSPGLLRKATRRCETQPSELLTPDFLRKSSLKEWVDEFLWWNFTNDIKPDSIRPCLHCRNVGWIWSNRVKDPLIFCSISTLANSLVSLVMLVLKLLVFSGRT